MSLKIEVTTERGQKLIVAVGRLTEERDLAQLERDRYAAAIGAHQRSYDLLAAVCRELETERDEARTALRAIIARADTDKPGTSKVQDIRRLAAEALGEG